MRNATTICDHCSSHNIRLMDAELKCDMCGWRKYLPLGRLDKRPYKFQVKYIGDIRRDKRTPITIAIDEGKEESNRVMKYELYCKEINPNCADITEQKPR